MAEGEIRNAIVARSEENVRSAHQRLVTEQRERVIGVSVIEKLQDRWGVDKDKLTREATALGCGRTFPGLRSDRTEQAL
jgi:ABC-type xylose transport system substrate-binding protein